MISLLKEKKKRRKGKERSECASVSETVSEMEGKVGMGGGGFSEAELVSIPATPRGVSTPETVTPSGQRSPRPGAASRSWTPSGSVMISPLVGTPMKRVLVNLRGYLEDMGHLTRLNPQDAWLPITESRNGNAHYAAFHNLNAGVGFQALVLPVAFAFLGWCIFFFSFFLSIILLS